MLTKFKNWCRQEMTFTFVLTRWQFCCAGLLVAAAVLIGNAIQREYERESITVAVTASQPQISKMDAKIDLLEADKRALWQSLSQLSSGLIDLKERLIAIEAKQLAVPKLQNESRRVYQPLGTVGPLETFHRNQRDAAIRRQVESMIGRP